MFFLFILILEANKDIIYTYTHTHIFINIYLHIYIMIVISKLLLTEIIGTCSHMLRKAEEKNQRVAYVLGVKHDAHHWTYTCMLQSLRELREETAV